MKINIYSSLVHLHFSVCEDLELFEWIDRHQHWPNVGLQTAKEGIIHLSDRDFKNIELYTLTRSTTTRQSLLNKQDKVININSWQLLHM